LVNWLTGCTALVTFDHSLRFHRRPLVVARKSNQFENGEDREIDLSERAARDCELAMTGSPEKRDRLLPSPTKVDESVKSSLRAPSANGEEEVKVSSTNPAPPDGKGDQAEQRKRAVSPVRLRLATVEAELKESRALVEQKTKDVNTMHSYGTRHAECLRSLSRALQPMAEGLRDLTRTQTNEEPDEVREARELEWE
jgi:hypothetical protein